MKHNERARVAPLYFTSTHPFRTQKNATRTPRARPIRLGVWFACSLWSAFSGLARSAHLDPSACSLNARGARSLTNSALLPELARCASFLKSLVFAADSLWGGAPRRLSRPRENPQKNEKLSALLQCRTLSRSAAKSFVHCLSLSFLNEPNVPPLFLFQSEHSSTEKNATRTPRARPLPWWSRRVFQISVPNGTLL